MLGLKLNHVSKRGHRDVWMIQIFTIFYSYFLQVMPLLHYAALFKSDELFSIREIVNWCRVVISNDKLT